MNKFLGLIVINLAAAAVGYGITEISRVAIEKLKELKENGYHFTAVSLDTGEVIEINLEDIDNVVFFKDELKYAETV